MSTLNKMIYSEEQTLRDTERKSLWKTWVWGSDLKEKFKSDIGFNKSHLLGLILCRDYMLLKGSKHYIDKVIEVEHMPTRMALGGAIAFNNMNTSTFFRTLKSIQCAWNESMYKENASKEAWGAVEHIVFVIFHHLGFFAHYSSKDPTLFDCAASTEVLADGMLGLTASAIRGALDVLVIFFRHIDLHKRARTPKRRDDEAKQLADEVLIPHAVEATKVILKLYIYIYIYIFKW